MSLRAKLLKNLWPKLPSDEAAKRTKRSQEYFAWFEACENPYRDDWPERIYRKNNQRLDRLDPRTKAKV